jgi:hypothetical protein
MSHVFINTMKTDFRPFFKDGDGLYLSEAYDVDDLEVVTSPEDIPGGYFSAAASLIEFMFWGANAGYAPDPGTVSIVRWETVTIHKNDTAAGRTTILVPVLVFQGTVDFATGALAGYGADVDEDRGPVTEVQFIANEITATLAITESSVYSPSGASAATLTLDNHGTGVYSIYFSAAGYGAAYRFW